MPLTEKIRRTDRQKLYLETLTDQAPPTIIVMKTSLLHIALCAFLLGGFSACSKKNTDSADHGHGHHVHVAPHGGTLIEIGDHQFNLELVRDAATGTLNAYVLDAHAENFVRLPLPSLSLTAHHGGTETPLVLHPVANAATGETAGDTSQFSAQADWLKTTPTFDGVVPEISIRGSRFEKIVFNFPNGKHAHTH
jgi:hypothetical protein